MMGIEYLTVGGYIKDGVIYCRSCGEEIGLKVENSHSVATFEADFPEGISCDRCQNWIVEPPPQSTDSDYRQSALEKLADLGETFEVSKNAKVERDSRRNGAWVTCRIWIE